MRSLDCQLRIREVAEGNAQSESRTIEGTAIVFGVESQVLDDFDGTFREVIAPEAVTAEWLATQDVKMNMLHERELTIARCNKGVGNLNMRVDAAGVHFSFEAPKCDLGDRALALIRSGVLSGCSFEFWPQDYDVDEREGEIVVTHRKFRALGALTIGMDPAYLQTSVNARELAKREEKAEEGDDEVKAEDGEEKAEDADEVKADAVEDADEKAGDAGEAGDDEAKVEAEARKRQLMMEE